MTKKALRFNSIKDAITDIANGKMVIVVDDDDRENEGDLVMAAHFVTTDAINFMIKYGKGLVCVPVTDTILDRLEINDMVAVNKDAMGTAFMVSVDATPAHGVSTGISAADRAKSIQVLINPNSQKSDLNTPGHIFPLRARSMGVLRRAGHTEAAVDLARLAGLTPAGVICEIINDDGSMARGDDLFKFSETHDIKIVTIKDLIHYRIKKETFIERGETAKMPTKFGEFRLTTYRDTLNDKIHVAIVKGDPQSQDEVMVRVHSECLTGDIFHSLRCDCGDQLSAALSRIESEGCGVVLYMRQEGRGIGLENKIKAYQIQDSGKDTIEANIELGFPPDLRDYGVGAQILLDLGVEHIQLLTNNPRKVVGLEGYGLTITRRVSLLVEANPHNKHYLDTKFKKMGHLPSAD